LEALEVQDFPVAQATEGLQEAHATPTVEEDPEAANIGEAREAK